MTVGIDLIEIERIRKSINTPGFLAKVFSPAELKFFTEKRFAPQTIAANFCVKEAFAKALGTGIRGFSLNEVTVLRDALGAPYIMTEGKAKEIVESNHYKFSVSISHTENYATAVVLAERAD